jgi:hypothetical protein
LERSGYGVLGPNPIRLGKVAKGLLVVRAWLRFWLGLRRSDYGGTGESAEV